jgi:uncharacterized protein YgiM (DUF1202 family)
MTRVILALLIAVISAPAAFAEAMSPGVFFVTADTLKVRLAANAAGQVASKLHSGQVVEVLEVTNGWARISEYFDGASEGLSENVARWVLATHLSAVQGKPENSNVSSANAGSIDPQAGETEVMSAELFFVTARTLNVRLAANTSGSVASKLHHGQEVEVFEVDKGWARISEYFDGASEGLSGNVARWVSATHLSAKPPGPKKVDVDSSVYWAIGASDDLTKHRDTFMRVTKILVASGECKLSEFRDIGGWWRSTAHKPRPIYYTYCGGASNSHRIYLDATTGQTFR